MEWHSKPSQRSFDLRQKTVSKERLPLAPIAPQNPLPPPGYGRSDDPTSQPGPHTSILSCGRLDSFAAERRSASYAVRVWDTALWSRDRVRVNGICTPTPSWSRAPCDLQCFMDILAAFGQQIFSLWSVALWGWDVYTKFLVEGHCTKAQAVYLHYSSIFTGANACVRKTKNVRKLLEKNKRSFKALISEYYLGTIRNVAKELLDVGIFESTSKAQTQFLNCSNAPMINGKRRASLKLPMI